MQDYTPNAAIISPATVAAPTRRRNSRLIIFLIVIVLLGGAAMYHYTDPSRMVQSFYNAYFVQFDTKQVLSKFCQAPAAEDLTFFQEEIDGLKADGAHYDFSLVNYTLVDEQFFGIAHVQLSGTIIESSHITPTRTYPIPPEASKLATMTLESSGLGWCISSQFKFPI